MRILMCIVMTHLTHLDLASTMHGHARSGPSVSPRKRAHGAIEVDIHHSPDEKRYKKRRVVPRPVKGANRAD